MAEVKCAYDEMVDITQVVENPKNPNTHNDKQIELLAKIIDHQGWRAPITVSNRSGFVVKGHGRLMAAQKLGCEEVPVDFQDYANEADEWADMIADNRIAELAEVDEIQLKELLYGLNDIDFDLALTGYEEFEFPEEPDMPLTDYESIENEDDGNYLCALECANRIMERLNEGAQTQDKIDLKGMCDSCEYFGEYCIFDGEKDYRKLIHAVDILASNLLRGVEK